MPQAECHMWAAEQCGLYNKKLSVTIKLEGEKEGNLNKALYLYTVSFRLPCLQEVNWRQR